MVNTCCDDGVERPEPKRSPDVFLATRSLQQLLKFPAARHEKELADGFVDRRRRRRPDDARRLRHAHAVAGHAKEFWARLCGEVERGTAIGTVAQRYGVKLSTPRRPKTAPSRP